VILHIQKLTDTAISFMSNAYKSDVHFVARDAKVPKISSIISAKSLLNFNFLSHSLTIFHQCWNPLLNSIRRSMAAA